MHMVIGLDFEAIKREGKITTYEEYIDEYITAEIPEKAPVGDHSAAARLQNKYREFVLKSLYHTCSPNYCQKNGPCSKYFPVKHLFYK